MLKLVQFLSVGVALASSTFAATVGLNPASPLGGFDLGGGQYATLIGVQAPASLVGTSITLADLNAAIISGSVSGFYYGAGNPVSGNFANVSLFAPFVSDTVLAGSNASYNNRVFDSLYAVHTGTVVFSNGSGGTTTMAVTGNRIARNPFPRVPDSGTTIVLFGLALGAVAALRRRLAA